MKSSYPDVTDLFCGAGGSSWGAEQAGAEVRLAMNHWERAIATHSANFPNVSHDICDISAVDPRRYRRTSILIASPECTNHSLAKGQKRKYQAQLELFGKVEIDPAAERSRVTMFDVPRFADHHDYDIVIVENVVDARKWRLFDAWLNSMVALDYDYEIVYLNSMFAHLSPLSNPSPDDFAPQSRDRMYVVFWKSGIKRPNLEFRPLAFCPKCEVDVEAVQSWKKGKAIGGVYGERRQYVYCCPTCAQPVKPYYYCAANCIDFSTKGERIGDRKRPLKPKTIERIRLGLQKFGSQAMLIPQAYSHGHDNRAVGVHMPAPTQTTRQDVGITFPPYLLQYYSRDDAQSGITDALPTVTTEPRHALITPPMVMEMYRTGGMRGVNEALSTVTAEGNHHALVSPPPFLSVQYSPGYNMPVSEPMGTVTTNDHHALVTPPPFLMSYYGGSNCYQGVFDDAVGTMTAKERHALVHPQVEVEDCHFRMLMPREIGLAMGFNPSYQVIGTKKEQVRQYGNAVTPVAMKRLTERCLEVL